MNFTEFEKNLFYKIEQYSNAGGKLCTTSSFQTQSVPLLHIISKIDAKIPVLFIDTGFHFPETYTFVNELKDRFNLNVVRVSSNIEKYFQKDTNGMFLYNMNPDSCCNINKVIPLDIELNSYDVWIAGVRRDQTENRKNSIEEVLIKDRLIKFQPMLDWDAKLIYKYIQENNLPKHPLENKGYFSVGCMPCTKKMEEFSIREGRWTGLNKKECGIHLNN